MIISNQWYNIARTSILGSTTGIRIEFGSHYALIAVAVDYGNVVITTVESNIGEEKIKVGARIRYNRGWHADVRISPAIEDADLKASVYENNGWTAVSPNTSTTGTTVCIIDDIDSLIQHTGSGDSLWEKVNIGTKEAPIWGLRPKDIDNTLVGIFSDTFVTAGGRSGSDNSPSNLFTRLDSWDNYDETAGDVLSALLGYGLKQDIEALKKSGLLDESKLKAYLDKYNYLTKAAADLLYAPINSGGLWEKVNIGTEEAPVWAVRPKDIDNTAVGIFSDTYITAGGRNGNSSEQGNATTLGGLVNVDDTADELQTEDVVLVKSVDATHWTLRALSTLGLNKTELESYLTTNSYLKKDTADGLYAPLASFNTLNTKVNDFLTGTDTDSIINKWKELEAFLAGQTETSTLADLLAVKADKTALQAHIDNYNYFVGTIYAAHISAYNTHIADYNTFKTDTQRRLAALEALWDIDEENNGLYPKSGRGIWSESYITAGGVGTSGSGSGGLIQTVYGYNSLGGTFDNTVLTDTFNAYTINQLYISGEAIKDRVEVLEANMGVINPDTLLSLNNYIAGNSARITSLEDWMNSPTAETAYFNELGVRDKLNVSGSATFDERITGIITEAVNLTGTPEIKITDNTIAVLVGEKTSAYITVPYAAKTLNDSNGNSIIDTYAKKADVNSLSSTLADHIARIISIEDTLICPSFDTLYVNELGIRDKVNIAGPATFDSSVTADVFTGLATNAIADKDNNDITTTYALKKEIGAAIEKLAELNDGISSINDWMVNASTETLLTRELGVIDKLNVSGTATFDSSVTINGNTVVGSLTASNLNVTGVSTFTGKTTHNGGIGATTGTFSSTLSAGVTTVESLTSSGNISATSSTILGHTGRFFDVMPRTDGSSGVYNLGSSDNRWTAYLKSADVTGNIRLKPTDASYGNYLYFGDSSYCYIAELTDDKMTIYASSGLQITANTDVSGNIYATGQIAGGQASDRKLKDDIQTMTDIQATKVLKSLRPVTFRWNGIAKELGNLIGYSDGFIADEYEILIPNSGRAIWNDYRAISYERTAGYLVKGWQNHETRLERLERENRELKTEVEELKKRRA